MVHSLLTVRKKYQKDNGSLNKEGNALYSHYANKANSRIVKSATKYVKSKNKYIDKTNEKFEKGLKNAKELELAGRPDKARKLTAKSYQRMLNRFDDVKTTMNYDNHNIKKYLDNQTIRFSNNANKFMNKIDAGKPISKYDIRRTAKSEGSIHATNDIYNKVSKHIGHITSHSNKTVSDIRKNPNFSVYTTTVDRIVGVRGNTTIYSPGTRYHVKVNK